MEWVEEVSEFNLEGQIRGQHKVRVREYMQKPISPGSKWFCKAGAQSARSSSERGMWEPAHAQKPGLCSVVRENPLMVFICIVTKFPFSHFRKFLLSVHCMLDAVLSAWDKTKFFLISSISHNQV